MSMDQNHGQRYAMQHALGAETLHTQVSVTGMLCGLSVSAASALADQATNDYGEERVQSVEDVALIFNELLEGAT